MMYGMICKQCTKNKSKDEFSYHNRDETYSTVCKACVNERNKKRIWRESPEQYQNRLKKNNIRRAKHREWFLAFKATQVCKRCGFNKHPIALHFHHRDPVTKSFAIASRVGNVGLSTLQAEIAKCDVLCANCHAIEHIVKSQMA